MRQEVDCLWETAEVQEALAALTGTANPDMANRLTVKEYNAYITCQVANNLDAQAWARVDRKKRPAELAAELAPVEQAGERASEHQRVRERASARTSTTSVTLPQLLSLFLYQPLVSLLSPRWATRRTLLCKRRGLRVGGDRRRAALAN